ncbi:hypothetical protein [Rhizobium leguminosarum]|uniref:hypothetical protein n=1 Tax=Rhizobium leguminosarum TaxID=384 RepID=UPI003F944E4D
MNRVDAIRALAEKGFTVKERSWSFRDSICVFGSLQDFDEIRMFGQMAIIYPMTDERWAVYGSWAGKDDIRFVSLADAVAFVLKNMSPTRC